MTLQSWKTSVEKIINRYEKTLITYQEFEEDIKEIVNFPDSPLKGLIYEVICTKLPYTFELGIEAEGNSTHSTTTNIESNREIRCILKIWIDLDEDHDGIETMVSDLFQKFWKSDLRASPSGLISIKDFQYAKECAQNKLDEGINDEIASSVLFCDLDHFKSVNDALGMDTGDRVIQEVACLLEKVTIKIGGILLNNGGDEYVILYPKGSPEHMILLAYKIKREIKNHDFDVGEIPIDVSIGISTNYQVAMLKSFSELLNESESALKAEVKKKTKGVARFAPTECEYKKINDIKDSLNYAFCLTKSNLMSSYVYNNVWLNALSIFASRKIEDIGFSADLTKCVNEFMDWIKFDYDSNLIKTSFTLSESEERDFKPEVSALDVAMAISHGLMASLLLKTVEIENKLTISFNGDYSCVNLVCWPNNEIIWSSTSEEIIDSMNTFDLGHIWNSQDKVSISPESLKLAILIKIGHPKLDFTDAIFADTIVVDDRPTKGGGLPDFWEATIARLIVSLSKNPNISKVFVIGNKKCGVRTIEKLEDIENWDNYFIHKKTSVPLPNVEETTKRLKNNVEIVEEEMEIVETLASLLRDYSNPVPVKNLSVINRNQRFLERELRMDSHALTKEDGCRVRTIAEAFPTVLEIVRKIRDEDKAKIYDQAERELIEMVDFKVHLTDPLYDTIPKFYAEEEKSLKDYFENQFISDTGLFGKVLKETNQLEEVIKHTIQTIDKRKKQSSTRRSILVIQHLPEDGEELAPLGLVAIRIIPRFVKNKVILNYSYVWRTVEALVGFPYSIYGSVFYSKYLTDKISSELSSKNAEMGFVSYIAQSLHIFVDDYGQNIAKRIVDDASV